MATERISVSPAVVEWMFQRTGKHPDQKDAPRWIRDAAEWLEGKRPTLKQLIKVAGSAHIPVDHLLRNEPPAKATLPLPDMRTVGSREIAEPSLELLEIIHMCEWRQEWYREYLRRLTNDVRDFVGRAGLRDAPEEVAAEMRRALGIPTIPRRGTWEDRVRSLTAAAEAIGVLVMRASMIGSWHRMLDPEEFRGFALADERAPLIFVNGADSRGAQAFTLVHELAHLWLGKTALSGGDFHAGEGKGQEQWCNQVAAEFLVPAEDFAKNLEGRLGDPQRDLQEEALLQEVLQECSQRYKVSSLVVLLRLKTLGYLAPARFQRQYDAEQARLGELRSEGGGSHATRARQVNEPGGLLVRAVIDSVREGSLTFTRAFGLLGIKSTRSLREIGRRVGAEL